MLSPDITYQYAQAKDTSGGTLQIVNKRIAELEPDTIVVAEILVVPADKVFVLSAATATGSPGISQICIDLFMFIWFENSAQEFMRDNETTELANNEKVIRNLNFAGEIWVPPNSEIRCRGNFDDDAANNAVQFAIHGLLIPRGNVHQG